MSDKLTPSQYRTLSIIARYPGGQTALLALHWCDRHHQALLKHGYLKLRADPFKTKADMLRGSITARGRKAVASASDRVKAQAKADEQRDHERYVREREAA